MRAQVVCRTVTGVSRAGADEVQLWAAATNASNPCRPDQDCPADFNEDGVVNAACGSLNAFTVNTLLNESPFAAFFVPSGAGGGLFQMLRTRRS